MCGVYTYLDYRVLRDGLCITRLLFRVWHRSCSITGHHANHEWPWWWGSSLDQWWTGGNALCITDHLSPIQPPIEEDPMTLEQIAYKLESFKGLLCILINDNSDAFLLKVNYNSGADHLNNIILLIPEFFFTWITYVLKDKKGKIKERKTLSTCGCWHAISVDVCLGILLWNGLQVTYSYGVYFA